MRRGSGAFDRAHDHHRSPGAEALIAWWRPSSLRFDGAKLAAQTVPVLGAVAGATINYHFTRYYREIARVHFGLLRLSQETGIPREALIEALELRMNQLRPRPQVAGPGARSPNLRPRFRPPVAAWLRARPDGRSQRGPGPRKARFHHPMQALLRCRVMAT